MSDQSFEDAPTPNVTIYTDGGCRGNPGPGGWGALLEAGRHRKTLKGGERDTTNNRMELTAAIQALRALDRPCRVDLWTDSQYVRKGITEWIHGWQKRGWQTAAKQPVKNAELWRALLAETERHQVEWHWVKGHSGHEGNEAADRLVNEAIDEVVAASR
ncbi:ribonuclease HI [Salinicola halophilus]|uniref:ribonuclease HI n=1 Tax=Salinicola halophilus TaxID=184065 RepID=UPI000DA16402|nr:ribonuclease HI [Salinicola halophilus]